MKSIRVYAVFAVAVTAVFALSSFTSSSSKESQTEIESEMHIHSQGKHCSGTVGCDCPGFSPITNGDEWQKLYCKHCGHKRSCHR